LLAAALLLPLVSGSVTRVLMPINDFGARREGYGNEVLIALGMGKLPWDLI